jgi:hypothetical protein
VKTFESPSTFCASGMNFYPTVKQNFSFFIQKEDLHADIANKKAHLIVVK